MLGRAARVAWGASTAAAVGDPTTRPGRSPRAQSSLRPGPAWWPLQPGPDGCATCQSDRPSRPATSRDAVAAGDGASARPRRVSAASRSQSMAFSGARSAVLLTPGPGERCRRLSRRAGVSSTMRRSPSPPRRGASRWPTGALQRVCQACRRGRPGGPGRTGSRKVLRRVRTSAFKPSIPTKSGRGAAPRRTRAMRRRLSLLARGALTSPASPPRVRIILASAHQRRPPWFRTRIAAAWTCPRSRGGSPSNAWTVGPCRPARASPSAPVRSSRPQAATIAWGGHPGASPVMTITPVAAAGRSR
jgi:hypothetical protein